MAFLNRIFHRDGNYDQTPPVHMIYPSREAYQMPIDYTGTGSSQWGHPQQQQPWQQGFPMGQQQMQQGMGGMMQPMQQQHDGMQGGFPGQQMGFGAQPMQPGMMPQGGFQGQQQMPLGFGAGPIMGGQQQHSGCPQRHHQGMPDGMQGEPHRMVIPGQHGVLVIEGPPQNFQQDGPHQMGRHHGQPGPF